MDHGFTYDVYVVRNGEILEQDEAWGNTPRTARAAANGLGRQIANFYEGATFTVRLRQS